MDLQWSKSGVGTLISFSTQPGNVALDGAGRNSPFAGSLVNHMSSSNDDLSAILISVRNDVMKETKRKQVPWEHSALTGRFYFNPAAQTTEPSNPARARLSEAAEAWGVVKDTTSISAFESFISRFKDTFYAELARQRIEDVKKEQVAAAAPPAPFKPAEPAMPKDTFRDCSECPEMVVVAAGSFMMGSPAREEGRSDHEGSQRNVTIARPFAVGKYEVTFAEWDACVAAGGCKQNPDDDGWGRGKRPVINVSWDDITKDYLPWLSGKTGKTYRLLTEAEWEYAARAGSTTRFHFGKDEKDLCTYGNVVDLTAKEKNKGWKVANCRDGYVYTAPVGSFKANAFGLYDMHGNVWEWVQDCYRDSYASAPVDGSAVTSGDCTNRVARGGSWIGNPLGLRSASRSSITSDARDNYVGFRLARTPNP